MAAALRRDARRNRDALLRAAGDLFAEQGLQASLEQVARRAGVAIGALYRHFPTRTDLIEALLEAKLRIWLGAAERAAALPDAWAGFVASTRLRQRPSQLRRAVTAWQPHESRPSAPAGH